jgi:hypothetical protein
VTFSIEEFSKCRSQVYSRYFVIPKLKEISVGLIPIMELTNSKLYQQNVKTWYDKKNNSMKYIAIKKIAKSEEVKITNIL